MSHLRADRVKGQELSDDFGRGIIYGKCRKIESGHNFY